MGNIITVKRKNYLLEKVDIIDLIKREGVVQSQDSGELYDHVSYQLITDCHRVLEYNYSFVSKGYRNEVNETVVVDGITYIMSFDNVDISCSNRRKCLSDELIIIHY